MSMCYLHKHQYDSAIVNIEKCVALNPNDYGGFCDRSWIHALAGNPAEGVRCSIEGIRRNPFAPGMCRRDFSETMSFPFWRLAGLAASYAQANQPENAARSAAELVHYTEHELAVELGADAERWRAYWRRIFPFKHDQHFDHLLDGLRKAGVPT